MRLESYSKTCSRFAYKFFRKEPLRLRTTKRRSALVRWLYHAIAPQTMPRAAVDYYARLIDGLRDEYFHPFRDEVLQSYPQPSRILDVGSGTGQLCLLLADAFESCHIVGIDLSKSCIEVARERAASAGLSNRVSFLCIDLTSDNWQPESFDLVLSTCSLHHWRRPALMLAAARRLLAPSGQLWIMDDFAGASVDDRRRWVQIVEHRCQPGWVFRWVFHFESRFLAYSRQELDELLVSAGLEATSFSTHEAFFTLCARAISKTRS